MPAVVLALALAPAAAYGEAPASLPPLASTPFSAVFPVPTAAAGGGATGFQVPDEARPGFLKGRFLVGVTTGRAMTPEGDLASEWKFAPFIRNTPRRAGWGPSFGLNWFTGDISVPVNGQRTKVGELKVRPVMAGISYAFINGRAITNFSFVGGYAFNSARITQALPEGTSASIRVENAWVVRPNVGLTYALTHRLALVGSLGYVFTKPTITIDVDQAGQPRQSYSDTHRSDYVNATVGLAFSIF
jgi:hypothetical protein